MKGVSPAAIRNTAAAVLPTSISWCSRKGNANFKSWIDKAKASGRALDMAAYDKLAHTRATSPVVLFSSVTPGLFKRVIAGFRGSGRSKAAQAEPSKRKGADRPAVALEN